MSELLESLIKIEDAVNNISNTVNGKRNELSAKYKALTLEFDSILKSQTQKKLDSMKEEFESEILEEQNLLQRDADMQLIKLNNYYSSHQKGTCRKLFFKKLLR